MQYCWCRDVSYFEGSDFIMFSSTLKCKAGVFTITLFRHGEIQHDGPVLEDRKRE